MKKRLVLLTFCFSTMCATVLRAETGTVTIPPDDGVKQKKDNHFLAMSDKQFRPFAELLITGKERACARTVFLGKSEKWNSQGGPGVLNFSAEQAQRDLLTAQQMCYTSVEMAVQSLGNNIGAFEHMKFASRLNAGRKIMDPRVYDRARKMLPETTPQKLKNP